MINKKIGLLEYEESYLTQSFFILKNRSRIHDDLRDIYIYIYNMIKQVKKSISRDAFCLDIIYLRLLLMPWQL